MNRWQEMVREFHLKVVGGPTSPARPEIRDARLRARLVLEEAVETAAALVGSEACADLASEMVEKALLRRQEPDLVEAVDGVVDLIYVALGTAEAIGVDLDPYFEAVHRSNMAKTGSGAPCPTDGKKGGKPPGWHPPTDDIRGLLDEAAAEADERDGILKKISESCLSSR